MMRQVAGLRRTGSACLDLAWTAAGRFDGYWEHNLGPWDIAAGTVLIREAGGIVTDFDGGTDMLATGEVCAGNQAVQRLLVEELKVARGE